MTEFQRRTLEVVQGFPEGIHVSDIAELTGMSVRRLYLDVGACQHG